MSSETPDQARARLLAEISPGYRPFLHLAATTGIGVVALIVACLNIHDPSWREWLVLPLLFLLANGAEWRAHKSLLHHRTWPFTELFDRHTPEHHKAYQYHSMEIRDYKELKLVLIPSAGVLLIVLVTSPFAFGFAKFLSPNSGWFLLAGSAVYVTLYEVTHLCYHLPRESWIGSSRLIALMREHHRRHHHPGLMQSWNFNVTVPLFDWIKGTIVSREQLEKSLGRSSEEAGRASSYAET